jgi:hypothetical protein
MPRRRRLKIAGGSTCVSGNRSLPGLYSADKSYSMKQIEAILENIWPERERSMTRQRASWKSLGLPNSRYADMKCKPG